MKQTYSFYLDEEIVEEFREAVVGRHGKLTGNLGHEVSRAIQNHTETLNKETAALKAVQ